LTDLALEYEGVKNFNVAVKEWGDEIIFLRRVERGPSDKSYGIHVAQLAGLPREVVDRAKEVLRNLEQAEIETPASKRMLGEHHWKAQQLDLFSVNYEPLLEKILKTDIERLTPEKALKKLKQLKALAEEIARFER
jgi:DNA mismatch repair protein MutS